MRLSHTGFDGPSGPFSAEAKTPEAVVGAVEACLREVLGGRLPAYRLTAADSRDWTLDLAREQAAELGG